MAKIIVMAAASVCVIVWFVLCAKYRDSFEDEIKGIDSKMYQMPEVFFVGFGIMDKIHFDIHSRKARKRIHDISEITGEKYAQFHYYVMKGAEFTYAYLSFTLLLLLSAVAADAKLVFFAIILPVLIVLYIEQEMDNKLSDRREELLAEFPRALSKMTLLINSGMVVRDAWQKVSHSGNGLIYQEMRATTEELWNGKMELEVYQNFAERCGLKEMRRFSSTMAQNLKNGDKVIAKFLREMADELWEEKKHLAKRKGEAINAKLMLPITLIFLGILIMILVPVFASM